MPATPVGPTDPMAVPRFAGLATFARLPQLDQVDGADVVVVGVPFDSGTTYRPGARFGPAHVRESSRLLRPYNPELEVGPFSSQQVADAGDIACNPFDIKEAVDQIEAGARLLARVRIPVIANNDSGSKRTRFRSKPNRCRLAAPVVAVRLSSGPAGGQAT